MALTLDTKVSGDLIGVSGTPQVDAQTAQTLTKLLEFDENSGVRLVREAETNETEKTGEVEATDVEVRSRAAEATLTMSKATSDGIAWALRTTMGAAVSSQPGGETNAYQHVFKLTNYPDVAPYFTAAHRKGGSSVDDGSADFIRHVGLGVGTLDLRVAKNEFMTLAIGLQGLGRKDDGVATETFTGADFTTPPDVVLTSSPKGTSDAQRAENIDVWVDVNDNGLFELQTIVTTYVNGTKTATLSTLSGAITGTHDVRVSYEVASSTVGYEWKAALEALTGANDFKMKAANVRLYMSRAIDASVATPTASAGQFAECELDDFAWSFNRNATAGRCWRASATSSDDFAQQVELGDTVQRLTLNRKVRDYLVKQKFDANEDFGVEINAYGPDIDPATDAGKPFRVHLFFPTCRILNLGADISERKHRDTVEVAVLKGAGQPTVAAIVWNGVATYA